MRSSRRASRPAASASIFMWSPQVGTWLGHYADAVTDTLTTSGGAVIHDGVNIRTVAHFGRHIPSHVRTAPPAA